LRQRVYTSIPQAIVQIINIYKHEAKKRGLAWELTHEYAGGLFLSNCHYCNTPPMSKYVYKGKPFPVNGIDRVHNEKGYLTNNVVACCKVCNYAKHNLSYEEWTGWIKRLITFQCLKVSQELSCLPTENEPIPRKDP
jgi:hypothetical protein